MSERACRASVLHARRRRAAAPAGRRGARARRRRGAARDPHRRRAGRRHHAHSRARRGARARVLCDRGDCAARRLGCRTISPRTPSRSTPTGSIPSACSGTSTRRRRAACAGRARSRPCRSHAQRVESPLEVSRDVVASLPARLLDAQQRVRCDRRPPCDRALLAAGASSSACARTSAGTTRWTRSSAGRSGRRLAPARAARPVREREALVRARPEGGGRGVPGPRRGRGAVVARGRARDRSRGHALRAGCATAASPSTRSRGGSRSCRPACCSSGARRRGSDRRRRLRRSAVRRSPSGLGGRFGTLRRGPRGREGGG